MERAVQNGACPFCREHLEQYHTRPILYETEYWVLTENFAPYAGSVVHLLLIAKEHVTAPDELSVAAWNDLQTVLAHTRSTFSIPGAALIMRFGDTEYTGASITHLHAHIVSGVASTKSGQPILVTLGYQKEGTTQE